jgi:tight adherence protein B
MLPDSPLIVSLAAAAATGLAAALLVGPLTEFWDRFMAWSLADLERAMDALRIDRHGLQGWLRWWGLLVATVGIGLGLVLRSPVLAVPLVLGGLVAPRFWLGHIVDSRRKLLRHQLPPALAGLANAVRAGLPLPEGIATVAAELSEPLRGEFRGIVAEHGGGRPLAAAIEDVKQRLGLEPFTLFAATIQTTLQRGGRVSEMLEILADSLRELDRLERTMDSATASPRKTIFFLGLFPALFLLGFLLLFPEGTMLMFTTTLGQVLLVVAAGLTGTSVLWSQSILALET